MSPIPFDPAAVLRLSPRDNVVVALRRIEPGARLGEGADAALATAVVEAGHKLAVRAIAADEPVVKYGQVIGRALVSVAPGDHVHTHNLGMGEHTQDYGHASEARPLPPMGADERERLSFEGYHRPDGRVGTRNYIGVLTTVNCSGSVARFIAESVERDGLLDAFPNVDGIVPITHGTGCGMSASGEGYETLMRTLTGYARHPNFGAILLVGLGCEVMQVADLVGHGRIQGNPRFRYMTIQGMGGTRATVAAGVEHVLDLAREADRDARAPAPASALTVALQCGGSDGYSGITANPALGVASDTIVRAGGTTILSETSEIYGAEHLLTRRAVSREVGERLIERVRWWEDYCERNGGEMDNNPSPGNKRGGLTTILEKSLGAVAKGGTAPLAGVYRYGEPIDRPGFVFMDSPGYDPASVTGQIASGANVVVFTTGRGSVSGYKPVPCIKLATNTAMYERMSEDMDVNCGTVIDGVPLGDVGAEVLQAILRVASGGESRSEALGFGGVEFVPWQIGAVM